jgi:putative hydrolase of the HAD superfamily
LQSDIKAVIFDLDGTLYVSNGLGGEISRVACRYLAELKGITSDEAEALIRQTKETLSQASCSDATLSQAILALGGDLRALHNRFADEIYPRNYLTRNQRVVELLKALGGRFEIYLYTNNNRRLSAEIMNQIGVSGIFRHVFTIEDSWRPKPDRDSLENILRMIGKKPGECLFVGDRYDVDLRLPATLGCSVFLVNSVVELLSIAKLLSKENL